MEIERSALPDERIGNFSFLDLGKWKNYHTPKELYRHIDQIINGIAIAFASVKICPFTEHQNQDFFSQFRDGHLEVYQSLEKIYTIRNHNVSNLEILIKKINSLVDQGKLNLCLQFEIALEETTADIKIYLLGLNVLESLSQFGKPKNRLLGNIINKLCERVYNVDCSLETKNKILCEVTRALSFYKSPVKKSLKPALIKNIARCCCKQFKSFKYVKFIEIACNAILLDEKSSQVEIRCQLIKMIKKIGKARELVFINTKADEISKLFKRIWDVCYSEQEHNDIGLAMSMLIEPSKGETDMIRLIFAKSKLLDLESDKKRDIQISLTVNGLLEQLYSNPEKNIDKFILINDISLCSAEERKTLINNKHDSDFLIYVGEIAESITNLITRLRLLYSMLIIQNIKKENDVVRSIYNKMILSVVEKTKKTSMSLVEANIQKDKVAERRAALELASLYQTYSIGLLNYSENSTKKAVKNFDQIRREEIAKIEQAIIDKCFSKKADLPCLLEAININKNKLNSIRLQLAAEIDPLNFDDLDKIISVGDLAVREMKSFFISILQQTIDLTKEPPCGYAVIGFGSFAKKLMTPYSDIEFGFLIADETQKNIQYFTQLTYILQLVIINLGETILFALGVPYIIDSNFYDSIAPRGFAFDGVGVASKGGKTPLGDGHTFQLIHTPQSMAKYLGKDDNGLWWHEKEKYLGLELLNYDYIYGDDSLVREYQSEIEKRMSCSYGNTNLREHLAFDHFVQHDHERFKPNFFEHEKIRELSAKKDFYMYPSIAIHRLSIAYDINSTGTFNKIKTLHIHNILTKNIADKTEQLCAQSLLLRLRTYNFYQAQSEKISSIDAEDHQLFSPDLDNMKIIENMCEIYAEIYEYFENYFQSKKGLEGDRQS